MSPLTMPVPQPTDRELALLALLKDISESPDDVVMQTRARNAHKAASQLLGLEP